MASEHTTHIACVFVHKSVSAKHCGVRCFLACVTPYAEVRRVGQAHGYKTNRKHAG